MSILPALPARSPRHPMLQLQQKRRATGPPRQPLHRTGVQRVRRSAGHPRHPPALPT